MEQIQAIVTIFTWRAAVTMIAVVTMMDEKTVMDVIRWSHGKSSSPHIDDTN
jgi:hypothetical protein